MGTFLTAILVLMSMEFQDSRVESAGDVPDNRVQDEYYTVNDQDNLSEIAERYGSVWFWEAIYIANADSIADPHLILPGQRFYIPAKIAAYRELSEPLDSVLADPFTSYADLPYSEVEPRFLLISDLSIFKTRAIEEQKTAHENKEGQTAEKADTAKVDEKTMEAFREAFRQIAENEQMSANRERQLLMEIDGMVHDETRSKIGRDFFDIFYTRWQPPPEAYNFSIRITEQPAPGRGTVVAVQVNDNLTYNRRLQPQYDAIEQAAHIAARQTYRYLQTNPNQFQIY